MNRTDGNDTSSRLINGRLLLIRLRSRIWYWQDLEIAGMCSVKERLESNMTPRLRADLAGESMTLSGSDSGVFRILQRGEPRPGGLGTKSPRSWSIFANLNIKFLCQMTVDVSKCINVIRIKHVNIFDRKSTGKTNLFRLHVKIDY